MDRSAVCVISSILYQIRAKTVTANLKREVMYVDDDI